MVRSTSPRDELQRHHRRDAETQRIQRRSRDYDGIRVSYVMPGSVATEFAQGDPSKGADWKVAPAEVAEVVVNLLRHPARSLPSRVEIRPTKPVKK